MESEIISSRLKIVSFLNSLFLFLLSFIIIYGINLLTTLLISAKWEVDAVIRNFRVEFLIGPQSSKWNVDSIVIIYLAAPFISLFIVGVISRLWLIFRGEKSYINLFLMWAFFHSLSFGMGALIAGILTKDVVWYAIAWMGIPIVIQYLIIPLIAILLYYAGSLVSLLFFETCNYPNPANMFNRQSWMLNAALKPWLIGTAIILGVFLPDVRYYEFIILMLEILIIIPIFMNSKLLPMVYVYEEIKNPVILWKIAILSVTLFTLFRFYSQIF